MLSARARVLIAVEVGVAEPLSDAVAAEGAVLAGRRVAVRVCSPWGIRPARATGGKRDWVRRQVR